MSVLQESSWLKEIFSFITHHLLPLLSGPAPPAADDLLTGQSANHSLSVKHLHEPVYLQTGLCCYGNRCVVFVFQVDVCVLIS